MKRVFGALVVALVLPVIITTMLTLIIASLCVNGPARTDAWLADVVNSFSK
jgi:hypothetical protein